MCAATLGFTGCSGSSSSPPPLGTALDLQGFWKIWTTETGEGEVGPAALFLSVSEAKIFGADLSGTVQGNTFEFVAVVLDGGRTQVDGTLTTAISGQGTYTVRKVKGLDVTGTFRMMKFAPTGTFSVTGSIRGTKITHSTDLAVGIRKFTDPAKTALVEVEVLTGSMDLDFEMDFESANLALGVLNVGTGPSDLGIAIEVSTGTYAARPIAVGGTVNVTKYDPSGFTMTFTLNLNTGDSLSGNIDVRFDIDAFHPPGS
jgi:hypothetical protein